VRLLAQEALLLRGSLLANLTAFEFDSSMPLTNRAPSSAAVVEAAATAAEAAATAASAVAAEAEAWSVLTSLGLFDRIQSLPNGLRCSVGTSDCH
jgi:ABC-type multidrug transport system fused ATPase/permease subunit